jgi:hypothetical protein
MKFEVRNVKREMKLEERSSKGEIFQTFYWLKEIQR